MKKYIVYSLCCWLFFSSCNDWLDVKPNSQTEEDEMFTTYEGFRSALTGCYIKMKNRSLYGEYLTMSHIESMANLWYVRFSGDVEDAFNKHDYKNESAKSAIAEIYDGLYNVIVQANSVIAHLDSDGGCIDDEVSLGIIKGEAYALRALCHFDVLRLFGQMPQNPVRRVALPYAEEVSIKQLPAYYDYAAFCGKIESDLLTAEKALEGIDPVLEQGIAYGENEEILHNYRGLDLNYWAVKALQARFYLYTGRPEAAYAAAKEAFKATEAKKPVRLSGSADVANKHFASPSECLFALSNNELIDYSIDVLGNPGTALKNGYCITKDMFGRLYADVSGVAHIKSDVWDQNTPDNSQVRQCVVKKYYYDDSKSHNDDELLTKLQLIPMIRMSEVYLILMETTTNLEEANDLYKAYMLARNVGDAQPFTALPAVKTFVTNEMRREFYAEGQMFYTYKRLDTKRMMFADEDAGEEAYILPLPDSEPVH